MITARVVRNKDNCFWFWFTDSFEILSADETVASITDMDVLKSVLALKEGEGIFVTLGIMAIDES